MESKELYVQHLFDSIANYYDIVNSMISFGRDGYWRNYTANLVKTLGAREVLDVCAGTGMLSLAIAQAHTACQITAVDFSEKMLARGRRNLAKYPEQKRIKLQYGNASRLDFPDNSFDCATLAFSLRNVEDIAQVLSEMRRVVRPGGAVINLELSKPENPIFSKVYYFYFDRCVPIIGKAFHGKRGPYDYLPASLKNFPDRHQLAAIYRQVGLKNVRSYPLTAGIVAVHIGEKATQSPYINHNFSINSPQNL